LFIPFDAGMYESATVCGLRDKGPYHYWSNGPDNGSTDLIGSSHRLLTFLDELQVPTRTRDRKGAFMINDLPEQRRRAANIPVVDNHADWLLERILALFPEVAESIIPRWPGKAKFALTLTHDTDTVNLGAPKELLKNLINCFLKRDSACLAMFNEGVKSVLKGHPNPVFGFPLWKLFETQKRIKSCFYLFVRPKGTRNHLNDCKSDVMDPKVDWSVLREMARSGWEFGFHAPINAKFYPASFKTGREMIEEKLQVSIQGLRHHWFALDWLHPEKTFGQHAAAGYIYDSSIAWRGGPGFRAAACLPFRPFDIAHDRLLRIYELPVCLMDVHIICHTGDADEATRLGIETVEKARAVGGVAVLNWHTESICNRMVWKNRHTVLERILERYLGDEQAWFATPHEIIDHWDKRRLQLSTRCNTA
jgi:hypothetical protein